MVLMPEHLEIRRSTAVRRNPKLHLPGRHTANKPFPIHTITRTGHAATMQFSSKSFKSTLPNSLAAKYRKALQKHPFALFGLPFLATIVAGSFMLTPATALRYERYDRKNQQISQEEAMGLGQNRRKVNMKDEYYVSDLMDIRSMGAL